MTEDQKRPTLEVPFWGCAFLGKWRSSSESIVPTVLTTGFVQSLEFLKKSWNVSSYFPDLEKVWKRWSLEKMIKKSWVFFFPNLQQVLYKGIFFGFFFSNLIQPLPYVCSVPRKKLCSCVLRPLLITCLITLNLEEEIIVLEKVLEKVLHFQSKNLCEPSYQLFVWHLFFVGFFFPQPISPSCSQRWWV